MCRLALQLLRMLGNVLSRPRHALQCLRHALQGLYETWWYTTPLTSQLIRQQVVGFLFDVGFLGPCRSMPRSAKDLAKHAEVGRGPRGRCQACEGVAKQAYTS